MWNLFRKSKQIKKDSRHIYTDFVFRSGENKYVTNSNKEFHKNSETISFILIQIDETNINYESELRHEVEVYLEESGLFLEFFWSSLLIASCPFEPKSSKLSKFDFIREISEKLLRKYEKSVRLIHGSSLGLYGSYGSIETHSYCKGGCILTNFSSIIESLYQIEFGSLGVYN